MIVRLLCDVSNCSVDIETASELDDAYASMSSRDFDIYFVSYRPGKHKWSALLHDLDEAAPSCPIILLASDENAPAPLLSRDPDLVHMVSRKNLSTKSLGSLMLGLLTERQRRADLMAQIALFGASEDRGTESVLTLLRDLLSDVNKIHGNAALALSALNDADSEKPVTLLSNAVNVSDTVRAQLLDRIDHLEAANADAAAAPQDIDITIFLGDIVQDYVPEAEKRGQQLVYSRPDIPLYFSSDPRKLEDALRLLLRNSVLNSGFGAFIDISLSVRSGEVCIAVAASKPSPEELSTLPIPPDSEAAQREARFEERAGGMILIDQFMRQCNGSVDWNTDGDSSAVLRCFFPLRGAA